MKYTHKVPLFAVAATAVLTCSSHATSYLLDFANQVIDTRPSGVWNIIGSPPSNAVLWGADGSFPAGITVGYTGTLQIAGTYDVFNPATAPAWVGNATDTGAGADLFYTDSFSDASATLSFSGLKVGSTISLDLFSSRNSPTAQANYSYSLDGGATWFGFDVVDRDGAPVIGDGWGSNDTQSQVFSSQTDGYEEGRYLTSGAVKVGSVGKFLVRGADNGIGLSDPLESYAAFNAVRLTMIPEPASSGLALIGAAAASFIRRRR